MNERDFNNPAPVPRAHRRLVINVCANAFVPDDIRPAAAGLQS